MVNLFKFIQNLSSEIQSELKHILMQCLNLNLNIIKMLSRLMSNLETSTKHVILVYKIFNWFNKHVYFGAFSHISLFLKFNLKKIKMGNHMTPPQND